MSVIPPSHHECQWSHSDLTLQAVNNTPIPTFGTHSLFHGLWRTFRWVFIVVEMSAPILEDFLRHFGLLVNLKSNKLIDSTTSLTEQGIVSYDASLSPLLLSRRPPSMLEAILTEFLAVTQPNNLARSIKHNVTHHITTVGFPMTGRTRRLAPEKLQIARRKFDHMLELGIIQPS